MAKKIFRTIVAYIIMVMIGLVTMYEVFSFKWSIEDMSTLEKVFGVIMMIIATPLCFWIHEAICEVENKKGDK